MKALIIVDLQEGFRPPLAVVTGIKKILPKYRKVVFTRFANRPRSFFRTELHVYGYARKSPEARLVIEPPKNAMVLEKPGYGLTSLQIRRLKNLGIKEAHVCGVDTDACVLGVAYSLWDNGIKPTVLIHLTASRNKLQGAAELIMRRNLNVKKV